MCHNIDDHHGFHFLRILNPMLVKFFQEIFAFPQKNDIYSDLI